MDFNKNIISSLRHIILLLAFVFINQNVTAQTGIGTTSPHASAKLEVSATNKGFLPPRVTLTSASDATTIPSPAEGLLVYNLGSVGLQAGYYYWNGANWATIATATSAGNGVTSMDIVKLYSKAYSAAVGDIANANGFSFTVPVSGRYLFDFSSSGFMNQATMTMTFKVRQGTTDLATDVFTNANNNVHVVYTGILEVNLQAGTTYNVHVTSTGSRDAGDYDRVFYKLVAGNLPVTGQSVDYVSVMLTTDQSNSSAGQNVKFQTIQSGNIPYDANTGNFSLTAGKTYRLTALASLNGTSPAASALDIIWRTADGVNIGPLGSLISASSNINFSGQGVIDFIYTPTRNITVSLYISFVGNASTVLRSYATNAIITQIGSSAIVNPWTLSGNDTYNTLGRVGIGNTSPTQALDVTGNVRTSGNYMYTDGSSTAKKVSGYINAGTYLSFENIQVTVPTSGNRGLNLVAVSTPFYCNIGATYGAYGGGSGNAAYNSYISTTASGSMFGWHFTNAGDFITYLVNDTTNSRVYRITLTIGAGYANNFITIERLN
jgi:hypothetical protein